MYREPQNNPMRTNEEKRIFATNMKDRPKKEPFQQQPMVNLQVYQPPKPKPPPRQPQSYMPYYMPNPFNPAQFGAYMQHAYQQPPIIKEYNINIDGMRGDHLRAGMIYEDVLPSNISLGSANSLGERVTIFDFIRSIMFSKGDGEDINVDSDGHDSILSHLKFMDLNPYNSYKFSNNPYKGLPYGFLLYRSCYPIRHNTRSQSDVICASNSTGVNVRVYRVTEGAYMVNKLSQNQKTFTDFDIWREMTFYEYVRERIIKKNICPNFSIMYGYHLPTKCGINFDDIENVKDIKREYSSIKAQDTNINSRNLPLMSNLRELDKLKKHRGKLPSNVLLVETGDGVPKSAVPIAVNPDSYSGKALVALTEAPNYTLFGWASVTYSREGNIKRMKNTGYHPKNVWFGVLFQLMVALYTMQIHGICIKDFSLDKNVFIKDLSLSGNVTNYWKYIIDGVEYYIPNNGYLVLIDSNFRELNTSHQNKFIIDRDNNTNNLNIDDNNVVELTGGQNGGNKVNKQEEHKLYGKIFDDNCDNIKKDVFDMFKSVMNTNVFGQDYKNHGGCNLPDDVTSLLNRISNDCMRDNDYDIGKYFHNHMYMFMNNRVGSYLKESETQNVRRGVVTDLKRGQIAVYNDEYGSNKFCVYLNSNEGQCRIITKNNHDDREMIIVQVPHGNIFGYTKVEPIVQIFKANTSNLNEEDLLETYVINSN
jgi:hypothetical protein